MRRGVFGDVWIFARKITWHLASLAFAFRNIFTRPKCVEIIWIRQKVEILALDERLSEKDRIIRDADVSQEIPMLDVVLDYGSFVAGRNVLAPMPSLLHVRCGDGEHVPIPDAC